MDDDDLQQAARLLRGARHVAVLTGAGISAESGLPTFRGAGGLWRAHDPMRLATPEAFWRDPELVWAFYQWRRGLVAGAKPNAGHRAIVDLAARVPRLTLITQNVDRLHHRAGSAGVIELHGNLAEVRCTACGRVADRWTETRPSLPQCDDADCGGLLRPNVVWFGEPMPPGAWDAAERAARDADVLLVVGTSATVYPAAGLAHVGRGAVVEVNLERTPMSGSATLGLYGPAAQVLPKLVSAVDAGRARG